MNNITFDELWEILFALEDKLDIVKENTLKDSPEISIGKQKCLTDLIRKIEDKLENGGA